MKRPRGPLKRLAPLLGALFCAAAAATGGCAPSAWVGPKAPARVDVERVQVPPAPTTAPALRLRTDHYAIYTTVEDRRFQRTLAQVMEGAFQQYRLLAPTVPTTFDPMECFVFAGRGEWADFTSEHTGPDAAVYLKVKRGGYAVGDRFVAFYFGDAPTLGAAAHEGWHQFAARHFKGRLPPFLDEGLACLFENPRVTERGLPRWNWASNPNRVRGLRLAVQGGYLWPLEDLITLHAGEVVQLSPEHVEAFYAQNWAFARFLWEAEEGLYRPALQRLLADTASGDVFDRTNTLRRATSTWAPASARPLLEHYLGHDLATIERAYLRFVGEVVAADERRDRWHE